MAALDVDLQAAYVWSFPYYEMARTRSLSLSLAANPRAAQVNALGHRRVLSDHTARVVTAPNNDTLYSSAWLDLAGGPLELTVPRIAGRYWSLQFMDASTATVALVGSRNAGEGNLTLWIVREGDTTPAPAGARTVRLPTRDAWLLARIVVDSPQDLPAVHALQDGLRLRVVNPGTAPAGPMAPAVSRGSPTDGANYLAVANDMVARNGVPEKERAMVARWSRFGLGSGDSAGALADQAAALTAAMPSLNASLRGNGLETSSRVVQRWLYPNPAVGTFGTEYALRASVALAGLGALPPEEAIYLSATTDDAGQPLQGSLRYRIHVPASGVPTGAFWSLSMYQTEADGRLFFTDNPLKRYTVGDRTAGMLKNADGSMDIVVQRDEPTEAVQKTNWLPAPAGPFRLMLRAYLPSPALAQGRLPLPVVKRAP